MPRFFVTCARGLEAVLAGELAALGARDIVRGRGGVDCAGGNDLLYRASLWLRTAVRILEPVWEGETPNPDVLYDAVRSVDWSRYMTPDHTLAVDSNVRDSFITHSQYAARRVKDAICDQFRDKVGRRPSVDTERPMTGLNLHISKNRAVLSLDGSWDSLHKRGYRPVQTRAPLNEALAAGLLLQAGWDTTTPLADVMCGSGTFVIEAAGIALNRAPGLTRKWFGFMGRLDFDRDLWNALRDDARKAAIPGGPPLVGSDIRGDAINFATANAKAAGLGHAVKFAVADATTVRPPEGPPGLLIVNPPYGERIGEDDELVPLHRAFGRNVMTNWPGWRVFVFTASNYLAKQVSLKVLKSAPFYNGGIPCLLWECAAEPKFPDRA